MINERIATHLFNLIPTTERSDEGIRYVSLDGGLYGQSDYLGDFSMVEVMLVELENQGIGVKYESFKEGKRGHWVTLIYPPAPFSSALIQVEAMGSSLNEALCQAIVKMYI